MESFYKNLKSDLKVDSFFVEKEFLQLYFADFVLRVRMVAN